MGLSRLFITDFHDQKRDDWRLRNPRGPIQWRPVVWDLLKFARASGTGWWTIYRFFQAFLSRKPTDRLPQSCFFQPLGTNGWLRGLHCQFRYRELHLMIMLFKYGLLICSLWVCYVASLQKIDWRGSRDSQMKLHQGKCSVPCPRLKRNAGIDSFMMPKPQNYSKKETSIKG